MLVLLAVLIGYPDQASSLFRHLQGLAPDAGWWELVGHLEPKKFNESTRNVIRDDLTPAVSVNPRPFQGRFQFRTRFAKGWHHIRLTELYTSL